MGLYLSMNATSIDLPLHGKKLFFASDFHLGAPNPQKSRLREQKIIRWLDTIADDAAGIFFVGDIFDFWFEYEEVVPKGFIPFISKISQLRDQKIPIFFFTGNHDLWMKNYFTQELGIPVYHQPIELKAGGKSFFIGHGDGLGPGDNSYKFLKKVFLNPLAIWLFRWIHPDIGVRLARTWSGHSRTTNSTKVEDKFLGDDEWLWIYCKEIHSLQQSDYYVFGHRHFPLELPVGTKSTYFNLGEWVNHCTYLVFDGQKTRLETFEQ